MEITKNELDISNTVHFSSLVQIIVEYICFKYFGKRAFNAEGIFNK